jgi:hypothetical protein
VSFTTVPAANDALHVGAHVIPAGLLVTVPVDAPANVMVSEYDVCANALPANKTVTRNEKYKKLRIKGILGCVWNPGEYGEGWMVGFTV